RDVLRRAHIPRKTQIIRPLIRRRSNPERNLLDERGARNGATLYFSALGVGCFCPPCLGGSSLWEVFVRYVDRASPREIDHRLAVLCNELYKNTADFCRSMQCSSRVPSASLSVSACNCVSGSSQIFGQFQFHLDRGFKRHRV